MRCQRSAGLRRSCSFTSAQASSMAASVEPERANPWLSMISSMALKRRVNFRLAPRKHVFRVEVELAREIGEDEQQVAHFVREPGRVGGGQLGPELRRFLLQLVEHGGGIRPVEADPRRAGR